MFVMKKETSVYLDLWRFTAAILVFAEHAGSFVGGWIWHFASWGAEAVAIFFVLSGFVIAYVVDTKEKSPGTYAKARAIRLYSVVVPAMVLTWALDSIGARFSPSTYSTSLHMPDTVAIYLQSLTFTHQIWNHQLHFGTNGPFWSLGFEAFYYIIFGLAVFIRRPLWVRCVAIGVTLIVAGPRISTYLPLWLMGVGVYRISRYLEGRGEVPESGSRAALLWGALFGVTLIAIWIVHAVGHSMHDYLKIYQKYAVSPGFFGTVGYFYLLGAMFGMNLVAFTCLPGRWKSYVLIPGPAIQWLAGATFTIYLVNLPLLLCLDSVVPGASEGGIRTSFIIIVALASCLLLAEVSERRKRFWRRLLPA
jgi:peptidoglycan/LPS O-acetylase OafA/YrhL